MAISENPCNSTLDFTYQKRYNIAEVIYREQLEYANSAAREAQKMTRKMVVQKMQQFLPESEKAVTNVP